MKILKSQKPRKRNYKKRKTNPSKKKNKILHWKNDGRKTERVWGGGGGGWIRKAKC